MVFKRKNKRGNAILDTITIVVILFIAGIMWFVAYKPLTEVNADVQNDSGMTNESKEALQDVEDYYPDVMDNSFLIVFVLLWAIGIVASFMSDSHPIFFVFSLIMLVFFFGATMELSNYFEELTDDSDYSSYKSSFPKMLWIMDHLLLIGMVVGFSILIALYGKTQGVGT